MRCVLRILGRSTTAEEGMYARILILTVVSSFVVQAISAYKCACNNECECLDDSVVYCRGIGVNFPKCLPNSTKELHVIESPSFAELASQDLKDLRMLSRLHFIKTSLALIDESALSGLNSLEIFEIQNSPSLQSFGSGTFVGLNNLTTIIIRECSRLSVLPRYAFAYLVSLKELYLSDNAIESVPEDILDGTEDLRMLDLSNNKPLTHLPREVFMSLRFMEHLSISSCSLQVLYPEHVRASYESGSLTQFDGQYNEWRCTDMCEFITWTSGNNFSDIADMGVCSYPQHSREDEVLGKDPLDVCPSPNPTLTIILLVIFSACFICPIMYCCCGNPFKKLCSKSTTVEIAESGGDTVARTRQEPSAEPQTEENRDGSGRDYEFPREVRPTPSAPVMFHNVFELDRDVTEPRSVKDDPPSYDDVVENAKEYDFQLGTMSKS